MKIFNKAQSVLSSIALGAGIIRGTAAIQWNVTVGIDDTTGQPGFGFSPPTLTNVRWGDSVAWTLLDGYRNQILASTFEKPCVQGRGYVAVGGPNLAGVEMTVYRHWGETSGEPELVETEWYFDGFDYNCQRGAVFVINPPQNETYDDYKARALKLGENMTFPDDPSTTESSSTRVLLPSDRPIPSSNSEGSQSDDGGAGSSALGGRFVKGALVAAVLVGSLHP